MAKLCNRLHADKNESLCRFLRCWRLLLGCSDLCLKILIMEHQSDKVDLGTIHQTLSCGERLLIILWKELKQRVNRTKYGSIWYIPSESFWAPFPRLSTARFIWASLKLLMNDSMHCWMTVSLIKNPRSSSSQDMYRRSAPDGCWMGCSGQYQSPKTCHKTWSW